MMIGLFRKKPVVVEAMQYPGLADDMDASWAVVDWIKANGGETARRGDLYIKTLHGEARVEPGDWVIRGAQGDFWPCKPDIFEDSYEQFGEVAEGKLGETLERLFPTGSTVNG